MKAARSLVQTLILVVSSSCLSVGPNLAAQTATTPTVHLSPGDDLQAAVNAAREGTTFVLRAGVYRMPSVVPKNDDIFSGEGTVILNGSQVLTFHLDPTGSSFWIANATASTFRHGSCQSNYPLCGYAQDLFIDNTPQSPVSDLKSLKPGSWYFDRTNNTVYIPSNPGGHAVELGMRTSAFSGSAGGIQLNNLTVEKYAAPAQYGAIGGKRDGAAWVVNHVEVRWNHGTGINLGSGSRILNSFIHHNGQLGIAFGGNNCIADNNEISWNNYSGFDPGWEAGGSKFAATTNLIVKSNYVHDNQGPGLWTDWNNAGTLYDSNTVVDNLTGIKHEISYNAIIRNNTVKDNGNIATVWLWHAQIEVQNSSDVEIYGNTVEVPSGGGNGIVVINQKRGSGIMGAWVAANNYVHDNTVTYLGIKGLCGLADDTKLGAALGNRFDSNRYILRKGGTVHWSWFRSLDWRGLQAAGQEPHGKCCD